MLPAPVRSPLGLATLRAPRLRGRCIVATGPDHVVLCDHAVRGGDRLSSVLVLDGQGRSWWGNPDTGPDGLHRLESNRDAAEGAQRFFLDALCDRAGQGDPLGSLEVKTAGRGSLSWRTSRSGSGPGLALRGAISDARAERGGPPRAWVHDGIHRHLHASPAMTWTVDGRSVSLWLALDGHVVTIQIESGAAVGTVDGGLTAFVAELGAPRIDPGSLLATPGGGRIRGPGIDLEFTAVGPVGEGGPLSAIVGCVSLEVQGRLADRMLKGRGVLVDRAAVAEPLEARFERAGAMVAASVACLVPPREPETQAQAVAGMQGASANSLHRLGPVIGRPGGGPFMVGLDSEALDRALLAPIRLITDRGGKAWRSYLMHLCGRACGGSMAPYTELMAVPELVHVGSLIVDDVQDASEVRRGGPSCHAVHGTPLAINAGNAAYFLSELAIRRTPLEPQVRQRVLDLLFDGFRAGHAGQALDIAGLESAVEPAIESGSFEALEQQVLTIQWLKSGVPAGAFARMGAVVGAGVGGDGDLVEVLGEYFERVGTAFQIVDDVLNLRGFEGDLKQRGEDLSTAKVTLPLLACLARLDRATARSLWHAVRSRPSEPTRLESLCRQLEATGGIEAAHRRAMQMVDEAWEAVDRLVEDGQTKVELRALGRFLLLRFY